MKFTKQYNLRIKRGWIEHAVDVAGVKRTCEEDEGLTVDGLLTVLTREVDKAEGFLMGRVEEAQRRVESLRLPKAVREVQRDTVEASESEASAIVAERITENTLNELYKQIRDASRFIEDVRDFQSLQAAALEKLGRKYMKSHFPPPVRQPEIPPLAALAGSSHVLGTSSPAGEAAPEADESGPTPAAPTLDSLHQRREDVEARIAAFLESLRERPLHDTDPLDQLDRQMEEFLREVPARWRKRRVTVLEPAVPVVTKLDLVGMPLGCLTRVKLALGSNHLSFPHSLPVVVARGATAGPTVLITSAVHGNELNGIPLIHRLMRELDCDDLAGTLVLVPVVNVAGYVRQQREFSDGVDINRIMPGRHDGNCSQQFAHKLMQQLLSNADFLIDLHTASFGRVNSLYVRADMNDPITHRMAVLQHPQIIVHSTGPDGSLRGACMSKGIKAITVEIGDPHRFHEQYIESAIDGVYNILAFLKVLPPQETQAEPRDQPAMCSRSLWIFTRHGGVLYVFPALCQWVRKGEVIAEIYDLYGDLVDRHFSPVDGIIVGKSVNPVASSGDRVVHIGVVSSEFAKKSDDGH